MSHDNRKGLSLLILCYHKMGNDVSWEIFSDPQPWLLYHV
jgi:hypothetical protein